MSRKIESIVENCSECKHCQDYLLVDSNCDYAIVCDNPRGQQLLCLSGDPKRRHSIEIPLDCPLSDAE